MTNGTLRTGLRAAASLAAVSLFLVAGCSSTGTTAGTSSSKAANLAITFLPKNLGNAYFDTSDKGGKKAIDELGGKYAEVGPAAAAPDAQVQYINTLTQQGVGGIDVSANDKAAICDALQSAMTAGIKVVTYDSDTNPECRNLFINQATPPTASPRLRST